MQKLNKKKQNHTSHIAPHTSQKGITLIALIITIIVMLILVGVTINVALNGGLFEKAEDAAEQTQMASEKEQLMMAALGVFDVNTGVDFDNIDLPEGFREISKDTTNAVYQSLSGNWYKLENDGTITLVAKGISITPATATIGEGDTTSVIATLEGGLAGGIEYTSSEQSIATVNNVGLVTGISEGTATITAKHGNYTAICEVTVTKKEVEDIKYYYTASCDLGGVDSPAVITVKDLEEGYKQVYIYLKQGEKYISQGLESHQFYTSTWGEDDVSVGGYTVKNGDSFTFGVPHCGIALTNDVAILYRSQHEMGWCLDLVPVNDEIRNIIQSSVAQ